MSSVTIDKPLSLDSTLESQLKEAKLLLKQNCLAQAIDVLKQLLVKQPNHADGLYFLAVCQRKSGKVDTALSTLHDLTTLHPDYARAYQEEGHNYLTKNEVSAAHVAFERAVELNPALLASWKALAHYYDKIGNVEKGKEASNHITWLTDLPPQLLTVTSLIYENKLFRAEQLCRHFLQQNKHHVEAMRLLAELGTRLLILDDAEFLLESCVEFSPDYQRARLDYVQVLHKRQKFPKALEQAKHLHSQNPGNSMFEIILANEYHAIGDFDTALTIYENVLAREPGLHLVHISRAHVLKTIGRTQEAIESYRESYRAKPGFGDAYWSLANLKTYRFTETELAKMRDHESASKTSSDDRIHLCFALAVCRT